MFTAPSRAQVEAQLDGILNGSVTRDHADRWAAQWVCADSPAVDDDLVWWALLLLHGIDLRPGPDDDYLHSDEQVAEWLEEFRIRSRNNASGGGAPAQG
ncbi:hypothetical protein [Nonomuraea bangladeshensis]|uniref:hypothetical protein n=1 Tax=Nonomuraea bangladeshensis TaxID=404385 RepID=UPI003C2DCEF0